MYLPDGDPPGVGKVLLVHVAAARHRRGTTVDDRVRIRHRPTRQARQRAVTNQFAASLN
jgi:hypothetical protein